MLCFLVYTFRECTRASSCVLFSGLLFPLRSLISLPPRTWGQCALFRVSSGTPCFFVQELDREMKELQQVIRESERGESMSVQTWPSSIHAALSHIIFRRCSPALSGGQSCDTH